MIDTAVTRWNQTGTYATHRRNPASWRTGVALASVASLSGIGAVSWPNEVSGAVVTLVWDRHGRALVPQSPDDEVSFKPRTPFGARLRALRQRAIAEGMRLLTADEVDAQVAAMRAGRHVA